jgi:hypothetical protein
MVVPPAFRMASAAAFPGRGLYHGSATLEGPGLGLGCGPGRVGGWVRGWEERGEGEEEGRRVGEGGGGERRGGLDLDLG